MKANDYYDIHRTFEVHNTNIFEIGAKAKYNQVATTPI